MIRPLFTDELQVINVGLASFSESIAQAGGKVLHLDWRPPAEGDREAGMILAKLTNHPDVSRANKTAFQQFASAQPKLIGVEPARTALHGMGERTVLHAGPPVAWDQMCGPMQGAVIGAILYERWAENAEAAYKLAQSGSIDFSPCHHFHTVGPMAGVISPSMPLWVVENASSGQKSFSNLNEGLGKVLRFGAFDNDVLDRLVWMQHTLAPALQLAIHKLGGIDLIPLIAQALHMGDECHNRNVAATSLFFRKIAPAMTKADVPIDDISSIFSFITGNDHFFLNISMAACKSMLSAAHGVAGSSLVTCMARNGVEFGIQMSGTGDRWFTTEAPHVQGLFFPGFSPQDAARDLGDSAITETCGIGGFAMAGAPAIVQFIGGNPSDALASTQEMFNITMGVNKNFTSPPLAFGSLPAGIDALKVVDTGIAPVINTGIAHRNAGIGQVGAGITRAPMGCFLQAINALFEEVKSAR